MKRKVPALLPTLKYLGGPSLLATAAIIPNDPRIGFKDVFLHSEVALYWARANKRRIHDFPFTTERVDRFFRALHAKKNLRLDDCEPLWIGSAVFLVFRANQLDESNECAIKASADTWAIHSNLRRYVHKKAEDYWREMRYRAHGTVSQSSDGFPYTEDCTAKLYFRFRKRNKIELAAWERELEKAIEREKAKK